MSFGPFGSGHGPYQKLTREYLAGQLPVFQERVPTSPKVRKALTINLRIREREREEREPSHS